METWAHCGPCGRWFYCPPAEALDGTRDSCPVCLSRPDRYEQRQRIDLPEIAFD